MAAGVFGYLGYDMVRLMEELPPPNPDPIGIPDAVLMRPTIMVVFDAVKDSITVVTPVRPEPGVDAKTALDARESSGCPAIVEALDRPLDKAAAECDAGPLDVPPTLQHHAGRIPGHGRQGQGLHRGRRHLPGRAVAALRGAVHAAAVLALPRAAAGQPVAVSAISSTSAASRSPARARKSWSRAPATGDHPPDRRHAAARRRRRTRTRRWRTNCSPTRRSAPST